MFTLWLHHQDTFQVILEKTLLKVTGTRRRIFRDDKGMITSEDVANKFIWDIKTKKRLDFYLQGKLAHLIKNWFPKLSDRLSYNEILNERESLLKGY